MSEFCCAVTAYAKNPLTVDQIDSFYYIKYVQSIHVTPSGTQVCFVLSENLKVQDAKSWLSLFENSPLLYGATPVLTNYTADGTTPFFNVRQSLFKTLQTLTPLYEGEDITMEFVAKARAVIRFQNLLINEKF